MKVYLDNNVVSDIHKMDSDQETAAVTQLLGIADAEPAQLEFVTSKVSLTEIERYRGQARPGVERVYYLLRKVPFVDDYTLLGFHNQWDRWGGSSCPLIEDDPTSSALWQIGLDRTDAHHVMLAIRAGCNVFLTCDAKSILHWRKKIEAAFSIRLRKPSELLAELTMQAASPGQGACP